MSGVTAIGAAGGMGAGLSGMAAAGGASMVRAGATVAGSATSISGSTAMMSSSSVHMSSMSSSNCQGPTHADMISAFVMALLTKSNEEKSEKDSGLAMMLGLAALGAGAQAGQSFCHESVSISAVNSAYTDGGAAAVSAGFSSQG